MNRTDLIDREQRRSVPSFAPGDTLKLHVRVVEGNKERTQLFQGVVTRRQGSGIRETFTVRKLSYGVGVERTFPLHSPVLAKIEVVSRGDVRRAKLYYLRDRIGKAAKIKEKRLSKEAEEALAAEAAALDVAEAEDVVVEDAEAAEAAVEADETVEAADESGDEAPADEEQPA